ncbi:alpha/beta hydrolase [Natronorubrum halophilum]|uniref:alpha/beta hydrolase n=1 Tax=Natronorubrum halophilum TaxID=1702106 RepID=UPI000EF67976|nr:alpha/beta hydrolase [Natronorubrum halophilum]
MTEPLRTDLHPEVEEMLEEAQTTGRPTAHHVSPTGARQLTDRAIEEAGLLSDPEPVDGDVVDYLIDGPDGDLPVRVYTPDDRGRHPVLLWFHGGGWVRGSIDAADGVCRALVNRTGCSVVSVEYRLAPEHPFPAGLEDCYAATEWVAEHPAVSLADPDRTAVGGASAGGNLAAAVSLLARERGGPDVAYQLLGVPVTDTAIDTESYDENAEGYGLYREDMRFYWDHYLENDLDEANPYVAPLRARDLSGLPPGTVITAGWDPLRDEGIAYYERLDAAGVDVTLDHYPDMPHNVISAVFLREKLGRTPKAYETMASRLRDAFDLD